MIDSVINTLKEGLKVLRNYPQLWFTLFVAVAIFAAFTYSAHQFISIARDAQDRLVNVRVGSLHDAFVPLATHMLTTSPASLNSEMRTIAERNPTIVEFVIVTEQNGTWVIRHAADTAFINRQLVGLDTAISLAQANPDQSFTFEEVQSGERFFRTIRAIEQQNGQLTGVVVTRQTLSEADRHIAASIQRSIGILVVILIVLLLLFLRHARIIDYTVLYRRLKEVDQLKDDFISMASHELRTPLTAIRGFASLLQEQLTARDAPQEDREIVDKIEISTRALVELVSDMLDVSRIEQGRMQFSPQTIDPHTVLTSVSEGLALVAAEKNISLNLVHNASGMISVDPDRFRQIANNLIGNAVKYTQQGEVKVETSSVDGQFVMRVSDTGIGMSADEQARLFQKFYRTADAAHLTHGGTGLGLWITKQLVEAMGGTISVESIKGVGSHFIISFPFAQQTSAQQ